MDEATLKRAAEPFFTTKGAGKGTGLGLSMVHGLAAQSGGAMRMTSQVGEGTTVELWLPISETAAVAMLTPATALFGNVGDRVACWWWMTIRWLSRARRRCWRMSAHVVTEALSGARALDMLRQDADVDVVVTDHAMPGMTGAELARQIRQNWPELPVILATGYAELPNGEDPGLPRLSKPYRQEELSAQIAKVVTTLRRQRDFLRRGATGLRIATATMEVG